MICSIVSLVIFVIATAAAANPADFGPGIYQVTYPVDISEGPTWDARSNTLYYVDVFAGGIFSYDYNTNEINNITLNGHVTPLIPSAKNESLFIVGINRSVVAVAWDRKSGLTGQKVLTTVSQQFPTSNFNDGKADKEGRLWFGTMGADQDTIDNGVFYKITRENLDNPTVEISPVNISNGLAWNQANNKLYYIDSASRQIVEYDFDNEGGNISNPRVVFDLAHFPFILGVPDGMTIDKDDNLWIAVYGGGAILKANPRTGELLQEIALPARDVTSAIWGGPNFDILFVTTSRYSLTEEERKIYPAAGSVFAITNLNTTGLPVFNADIIDSI